MGIHRPIGHVAAQIELAPTPDTLGRVPHRRDVAHPGACSRSVRIVAPGDVVFASGPGTGVPSETQDSGLSQFDERSTPTSRPRRTTGRSRARSTQNPMILARLATPSGNREKLRESGGAGNRIVKRAFSQVGDVARLFGLTLRFPSPSRLPRCPRQSTRVLPNPPEFWRHCGNRDIAYT